MSPVISPHRVFETEDVGESLPASLFQRLVEQSAIAISITDLKANIVFSNEAFSQLTGYSMDQVIGMNQNILASHNTPITRYQELWAQLIKKQSWSGVLVNQRADNSQYLAQVTVSPVLNSDNEVTHYIGMQQDITERYKLEQKLKNQKKRIEAVINDAPIAIALLDSDGKVLLDNLFYKTMRYDFDGIEPAEHLLVNANPDAPFLMAAQVRGEKRWYEVQVTPVVEDEEGVEGYFDHKFKPQQLLFIRDKTDQQKRQNQEQVEQLRVRIAEEQLLEGIVETISAACLQIQQPLNLLQAASQLDPAMGEAAVIQDVLQAGQQAVSALKLCERQPIAEGKQLLDPSALIQDVVALLEQELAQANIELTLQLSPNLQPIMGQQVRLLSLFKLLLERAIKAISDHHIEGKILIVAHQMDADVEVSISDSGIAIEPEARYRIFQPLNVDHNAHGQLPGLGLSLAQNIINDHSGTISVLSSRLGGSKFKFSLPTDTVEE